MKLLLIALLISTNMINGLPKHFVSTNNVSVGEKFSYTIALPIDSDVEIKPDKLTIPALRPDERTQSIYYSTLVNTGIITPNEARAGLGFPLLNGEDSIRVPQNITGSATDATQGGRPPNEESENQIEEGTSDEG